MRWIASNNPRVQWDDIGKRVLSGHAEMDDKEWQNVQVKRFQNHFTLPLVLSTSPNRVTSESFTVLVTTCQLWLMHLIRTGRTRLCFTSALDGFRGTYNERPGFRDSEELPQGRQGRR